MVENRGKVIKKMVGYVRVSTERQGKSGLGMEAQQAEIEKYTSSSGCELLETYTDIETGKGRNPDRPQLEQALARAKREKAVLVVGKLDRLARNVCFLSGLMESSVEFVCCDNPHANRLTIHILAAVAEEESRLISERTKAALAAYKARGGKLGAARTESQNLTIEARRRGGKRAGEVSRETAKEAYHDLAPLMKAWRDAGSTLWVITDRLNEAGHRTRRGKPWNPTQVRSVLIRFYGREITRRPRTRRRAIEE